MNLAFDFSDLVAFEREHERVKAEREALLSACYRVLATFGQEVIGKAIVDDATASKLEAILIVESAVQLAEGQGAGP